MYRITDECIRCSLCESECPKSAIVDNFSEPIRVTIACDECTGYEVPPCIEICPVPDCFVIDFTAQEMAKGLAHDDPSVRLKFALVSGHRALSLPEVEHGLTDKDDEIRAAFSSRTDYEPSLRQIAQGLTDPVADVRLAFANRRDIVLSPIQIEAGLTDADERVRTAISARGDFVLTPEQLERGLTDQCISVRCNFLDRHDCTLSDTQIERARNDRSAGVEMRIQHFATSYERNDPKYTSVAHKPFEQPPRSNGESVLSEFSSKLAAEIKTANSRLKQYVTPQDIVHAIQYAANRRTCLLLQPGNSGYAWSDRTIPVVFVVGDANKIRVRIRRAQSRRNNKATPVAGYANP